MYDYADELDALFSLVRLLFCCRHLYSNWLTGDLPGYAVWANLKDTLTTMYVETTNVHVHVPAGRRFSDRSQRSVCVPLFCGARMHVLDCSLD